MSERRIDRVPINDAGNGWNRILPQRTPRKALFGEHKFDWLVIGAGYAGLAAARRLAENRPDATVALVEAGEVGENASGRNSGFAIDLPHVISSNMDELEGSHRYMALARAAIESHEKLIERYDIDCDWRRRGKYQTAVSAQGVGELLEPFALELEKLGASFSWIDEGDLAKRLGTSHFKAAVYTPGDRLLNPAALTRGLADNLPDNVYLFENSAVTSLNTGTQIRIKTAQGEISAPQMILCVNAFAEHFGFYQRQLLPFAANASLSRRLTPDERSALGCEDNWGVTPANALASITMRFTSDHRLLIRNNIYYNPKMRETPNHLARIAQRHKQLFDQRFPMLPKVEMKYTWTGYVCLSRNGAPGFGRLADNVHNSVCQNAIGVTKGTIGGLLAADMACGADNELIGYMQSLGEPDKLPIQPFLDLGVKVRRGWELWKARHEV
jgi:glycine/D-amino acid oxidase-like deaminating enzyme